MRRWQSNLLLLVLASLLSLGGGELASVLAGIPLSSRRTCPGEGTAREGDNFVPDPITGWRMRPSREFAFPTEGRRVYYHSDADGFRVSPDPSRSGNSRNRILLAGDSYAWGYGVDHSESLAGLLEARLSGTAVRNLAMPGFGLDQVWLSLRHYGFPEGADLAIVTIYPDDLERSMTAFRAAEGFPKPSFTLREGKLVARQPEDCPGAVMRLLERHSRIFTLSRRLGLRVGREWGRGAWWELNEAILDALRSDAGSSGVPLLVVHVPYESWVPFPALGAYMQTTGTPYLDLFEEFGDRHAEFYYPRDGHLNAAGHERLAELVEDWIETRASPR